MAESRRGPGKRPDYGHKWRQLRDRVRRNQGVCWICGGEINLELKAPHPESFSVDHVEPVSMRPDLALVYENLKASHRRCNMSRGSGGRKSSGVPSREW